jgi:hypothetical protein
MEQDMGELIKKKLLGGLPNAETNGTCRQYK